jgi:hypothetical protein
MTEQAKRGRPKAQNSLAAQEMDKAEAQFEQFDKEVKELTLDNMNKSPKAEVEPQTKIAQQDIDKTQRIYLKPVKTISNNQQFNEKFREDWNYAKEIVQFIAENKEIVGDTIEMWTHPFGGVPAEYWQVPVNKPVWGPRHLAEQIKKCNYHRLVMQENKVVASDHMGNYYGSMVADTTVQRLDAIPVSSRRSVFMGAANF